MADARITINCEDNAEQGTTIRVIAEKDYTLIFTEAFLSTEKPLGVHLIDKEVISGEEAGKSGSKQILSNLTELISNGLKTKGRIFTQTEVNLKSQIVDYPIIRKFEEIVGVEFDWSKFHNRREFKTYFWSWINKQ